MDHWEDKSGYTYSILYIWSVCDQLRKVEISRNNYVIYNFSPDSQQPTFYMQSLHFKENTALLWFKIKSLLNLKQVIGTQAIL